MWCAVQFFCGYWHWISWSSKRWKNRFDKKNFRNLFTCRLVNKKVISFSSNMRCFSHDLPKNLRKTCTVTIHKNMLQSSLQKEIPIPQPISDNKFFHVTFSSHIKLTVVSVCCQHTYEMSSPHCKNEKE